MKLTAIQFAMGHCTLRHGSFVQTQEGDILRVVGPGPIGTDTLNVKRTWYWTALCRGLTAWDQMIDFLHDALTWRVWDHMDEQYSPTRITVAEHPGLNDLVDLMLEQTDDPALSKERARKILEGLLN